MIREPDADSKRTVKWAGLLLLLAIRGNKDYFFEPVKMLLDYCKHPINRTASGGCAGGCSVQITLISELVFTHFMDIIRDLAESVQSP